MIRIGAEAGQAVSELTTVNKALGGTMSKSEKMGAALRKAAIPATIALTAIAVGSKKAISAASDLNEQANKTEVVFGKSGKSVVKWSKGLAESFGLSSTAALEAASQFGNMLVPMGYGREEAAKYSKTMVQLAGDMASFNNASPEETLAAIQSGLAGQSEPLRKYGVFLDQARIKEQALKMGLYSGKGAMDAHTKSAATMAIILKDTADTQGDFARTSSSAANQQRIQAAETENLSAALGQGLLPYYESAQRVLIKLTQATSEHTGAVKVVIGVIASLSAGILIANAAMKAYKALQTVTTVATYAWAVAQRVLNLALRANPIGLVITAVALLAAGLVIAYKRSETFRNIVNSALNSVAGAAKALASAFTRVWDAARSAFSWIVDHWRVAAFALGPLGAAIVLIATHFDRVKAAGVGAFNAVAGAVRAVASAITSAIDAVKSLIAWLGRIKVPSIKLPHIPGTSSSTYAGASPQLAAAGASSSGGVTVNFYGPTTDPEGTARAIARVLRQHEARQGRSSRAA